MGKVMAFENPLDRAGEATETVGAGVGELLKGTARFLEEVTGDATTAAIFAGFLLFALSLIRAAAGARSHVVYGRSIQLLGGMGLAVIIALTLFAVTRDTQRSLDPGSEQAMIYKGLMGQEFIPNNSWASFGDRAVSALASYQWYALIFIVMIVIGTVVLTVATATGRKRAVKGVQQAPPDE